MKPWQQCCEQGDLCCLLDATNDLTREKEREFSFSPFLTQGLNQKRRIKTRLVKPSGKVFLRLTVLARSIALLDWLNISSSDSLPAMVKAINQIVLRWLFPEHLKFPEYFQLWEVLAIVGTCLTYHFLPFNSFNVYQYNHHKYNFLQPIKIFLGCQMYITSFNPSACFLSTVFLTAGEPDCFT